MHRVIKIGLLILAIVIFMFPVSIKASESISYGSQWKSWSVDVRKVYIQGFLDGMFHVIEVAKHQDVTLPGGTLFCVEAPALYEYLAELYDNPDNASIDYTTMFYLARDKMIGRDISEPLIMARACSN